MTASMITVNIPEGMCFQVMEDRNPQIHGQYQHLDQRYLIKGVEIYKANTNVTVLTSGSVAYWRC